MRRAFENNEPTGAHAGAVVGGPVCLAERSACARTRRTQSTEATRMPSGCRKLCRYLKGDD